jgi:hypothetical protein
MQKKKLLVHGQMVTVLYGNYIYIGQAGHTIFDSKHGMMVVRMYIQPEVGFQTILGIA